MPEPTPPPSESDPSSPRNPKLIPEWRVAADDQIVLVGFLVIILVIVGIGWQLLSGDDDPVPAEGTAITLSE